MHPIVPTNAMNYLPPSADIQFTLFEVLRLPQTLAALPAYTEVDAALMHEVIAQAGIFCAEVLAPINATGDRQGCSLDAATGQVYTPAGLQSAYQQFIESGWAGLIADPEFGGQGLPHVLHAVLDEMEASANLGFNMYTGLLSGAFSCIAKHGDSALQARYLPKLASGAWLPTMALTEPQAGSDLGLIRTTAHPDGDGSYRLRGEKIFISGGAHDLTENIVHLVLARLPDAPAGSRGISLFLVPQRLPSQDGTPFGLGAENPVRCTGLEEKMGLHASPTCALHFDNAQGWLLGQAHQGLAVMFVMMNAARLHAGLQGLGIAELSYQRARRYATERLQLRAPKGVLAPAKQAADPILAHPAVQRHLLTQRALLEGQRMLAYWCAGQIDVAQHHPDATQRQAAESWVALTTPILKAMMTEQGFLGASSAMQVLGGHGYVCESGLEQGLRDIRVSMMYEGTNEIQAIDFVQRKVLPDGGAALLRWFAQRGNLAALDTQGTHATPAQRALLEAAQQWWHVQLPALQALAGNTPAQLLSIADVLLRHAHHCLLAECWLQAAHVAHRQLAQGQGDAVFLRSKIDTAAYFFRFIFVETLSWQALVESVLRDAEQLPYPLAADFAQDLDLNA